MKYGILFFLLSSILHASVPDGSECHWFKSVNAEGRIFAPSMVNMGAIMPEEVVGMSLVICKHAETKEQTFIFVQHRAFLDGQKLLKGRSCGMLAPSNGLLSFRFSESITSDGRTDFPITISEGDVSFTGTVSVSIEWCGEQIVNVENVKFSAVHVVPKDGQNIYDTTNAKILGSTIEISSQSSAGDFSDEGKKTWAEISHALEESVYDLPRDYSTYRI